MQPRIQYVKTSDGVNIAFSSHGSGSPAVVMVPNPPWNHLELSWRIPEARRPFETLADATTVIRYDSRGTGLSQRKVGDFSLHAHVRDLEAVADRLAFDSVALFGHLSSAAISIAYAAQRPEHVSHLALWCGYAAMDDLESSSEAQGLLALAEKDWTLFINAVAHVALGWYSGEGPRRAAEFFRECVSEEEGRAIVAALRDFDARPYLVDLHVPTLILHGRSVPYPPLSAAQVLAAGIHNARLVVFEGDSLLPADDVWRTLAEFVGIAHRAPIADGTLASGTAAAPVAVILFTDIADSTALTERLGDSAFRAKARELGGSLRALIRECGGTPVEGPTLGDGVLAVFTSAREAIEAAVRCRDEGSRAGLPLHVGLHAGDVMREKDPDGRANVYGGAVNIAARIAGASAAGEVLVSDIVRGLARTSSGVTFDDRGEHALKGVADPQRLFAVRTGEGEA